MKSSLFLSAVTGVLAFSASAAPASGEAHKGQKAAAGNDSVAMMGECSGINSCKGQGACGGKTHGCAGKNSCKGQGWIKTSKAECAEKAGKFKADKAEEKK